MSANPNIAALGGYGIPEYDISPPDFIIRNAYQYATGPQAPESGDITRSKGYVYGAGIVIRKDLYNFIRENGFSFSLTGRKGNILTSGEDFEMCSAFVLAGYKIWYDEELKFFHYLPSGRLTWDYLVRMNQGFGYSLAFLLPYITLINTKGLITIKYSYYYFLLRSLIKCLSFSFNLKMLLKKSDSRLEQERNKYLIVSLLKNRSAIQNTVKELSHKKFIKKYLQKSQNTHSLKSFIL
jgi:hypothetical protein